MDELNDNSFSTKDPAVGKMNVPKPKTKFHAPDKALCRLKLDFISGLPSIARFISSLKAETRAHALNSPSSTAARYIIDVGTLDTNRNELKATPASANAKTVRLVNFPILVI